MLRELNTNEIEMVAGGECTVGDNSCREIADDHTQAPGSSIVNTFSGPPVVSTGTRITHPPAFVSGLRFVGGIIGAATGALAGLIGGGGAGSIAAGGAGASAGHTAGQGAAQALLDYTENLANYTSAQRQAAYANAQIALPQYGCSNQCPW